MAVKVCPLLSLVVVAVLSCAVELVESYEYFGNLMPNGRNVMRNGVRWDTVGHDTATYDATDKGKNAFGQAWKANGFIWTEDFCQQDSDNDGQTNGMELGDPFCTWKQGFEPYRTTDISHPGFPDSRSSAPVPDPAGTTPELVALATTTTTTLAAGTCKPSVIEDSQGNKLECQVEVAPGVNLHWSKKDENGEINLALEKTSAAGWLSIAFPKSPGHMLHSHAVVSKSATETGFVELTNLIGQFPPLEMSAMRVPFKGAESGNSNGNRFVFVQGAKFYDLRQVSLLYALDDGDWEKQHAGSLSARGGMTVNLVSGSSSADEGQGDKASALVYVAVVGVILLLFVGIPLVRHLSSRQPGVLAKHRCGSITPLGMFGLLGVLVCCTIAFVAHWAGDVNDAGYAATLGLGLATALSASMPIWFSFLKVGVHNLLGISREVAWRFHALFGVLFVVLGTAHGISALATIGIEVIAQEVHLLMGLVAMGLVYIGLVPAVFHAVAGQEAFRYDMFKMLHFVAIVGYAMSFVHIVGQLVHAVSGRLVLLVGLNGVALTAWIAQRIVSLVARKKCSVASLEVLNDKAGMHVALQVKSPGFSFSPGQWAHLRVPAIGKVGHPFTIVPGSEPDTIGFIVKAGGNFTISLMREAAKQDTVVHVEGPYGAPTVERALDSWADAIVFVIGGVGITPVLSLAPAAKTAGRDVFLFWSLRSPSLLQHCAPRLGPLLETGKARVQLTGNGGESPHAWSGQEDALRPAAGRLSPAMWLSKAAEQLEQAGKTSALVFFCGPPGLAKAAREGVALAGKEHPMLHMHLHEETFRFLTPYK